MVTTASPPRLGAARGQPVVVEVTSLCCTTGTDQHQAFDVKVAPPSILASATPPAGFTCPASLTCSYYKAAGPGSASVVIVAPAGISCPTSATSCIGVQGRAQAFTITVASS